MVENDFGAYQASQEVSIISTNATNTDTSWNSPHSPAKIPTAVCKIVKISDTWLKLLGAIISGSLFLSGLLGFVIWIQRFLNSLPILA